VDLKTHCTLRELFDSSGVRMTYLKRALEIMSPSRRREEYEKRIVRRLELFALERNVPLSATARQRRHCEMQALAAQHAPSSGHGTSTARRAAANDYGTLRTLFRDALLEELVAIDPCVLPRGALPSPREMSPSATRRKPSVFSREEIRLLLTDQQVPADRRVLYALLFLTGMRHGEAVGRRWRDLDSVAAKVAVNGNDTRGFRPKRKMQIPDLPFRCREDEPQALPVRDFRFRLVRHHRQLAAFSDRVAKAPHECEVDVATLPTWLQVELAHEEQIASSAHLQSPPSPSSTTQTPALCRAV
jgi:integrase